MVGRLILGLALPMLLLWQALALARSAPGDPVAPWAKAPAVVVVGARTDDARLPLVQDAVAFWNRSFAELGSAFRVGPVTQAAGAVQVDELRAKRCRPAGYKPGLREMRSSSEPPRYW